MHRDRRRALVVILLLLAAGALTRPSAAQTDPVGDMFTTTTVATTAPPSSTTSTTAARSTKAPPGAQDTRGDGVAAPSGGIAVPPEAQRIINAVKRSAPSNNERLIAGLTGLVELGMAPDEALRVGLGRFPVAGVARWTHDWLLPRYGPGFRFHLGCDVVAGYGTPVRAPVDGVLTWQEDALGGLTARVTMPDRTAFAFAHLSAVTEGLAQGQAVRTGDVIGRVGDSGNAKGTPHVHVAVYPKGGPASDPKPILDEFLRDAEAALPGIVAAYAAAHPKTAALRVPLLPQAPDARALRPALSTNVLSQWVSGGEPWSPTRLYLLASDPAFGAGYLVQSSLDDLAATIDWTERALGADR